MNAIDVEKVDRVYFIGIGGMGMSALAQLFHAEGKEVTGSDREETPMTQLLRNTGIKIIIGHEEKNIRKDIGLCVVSDAVPKENPEFVHARTRGIPILTYFEALGILTKHRFTIAVSGTHGKTTTTGMLTKILFDAEIEPTAVIGSIVKDFESNFVRGGKEPFVVEACEYKDHILKLHPNILVITNIELDHTDFFKSLEHVQRTFRKAAESLGESGILIADPHDPTIKPILRGLTCTVVDYTKETAGELSFPAEFNSMNARAAKAAAKVYAPRLTDISIDVSIELFGGSWRRFEYIGETRKGALVYDDYAHHPTAIAKTIQAVREKFADKKITVVFHPHLYSRTKSFFNEFARALSLADYVIVAPIYAAREEKDASISHTLLAQKIKPKKGQAVALDLFDEIEERLQTMCDDGDIIITMGAGDIYKVANNLTSSL